MMAKAWRMKIPKKKPPRIGDFGKETSRALSPRTAPSGPVDTKVGSQ